MATNSFRELKAIQSNLRRQIKIKSVPTPKVVAGVDISSVRYGQTLFVAIVVMSFPEAEIIEVSEAAVKATLPYVPGFLAFREWPAIEAAWQRLDHRPEIMFVDGHGRAHPQTMGVATQVGVLLDLPTVGIAKKILYGEVEVTGEEVGDKSPIYAPQNDEIIGYSLRTKSKVKPVFISGGQYVSHEQAVNLTMQLVRRHRLPEPTRQAHLAANEFRRQSLVDNFPTLT